MLAFPSTQETATEKTGPEFLPNFEVTCPEVRDTLEIFCNEVETTSELATAHELLPNLDKMSSASVGTALISNFNATSARCQKTQQCRLFSPLHATIGNTNKSQPYKKARLSKHHAADAETEPKRKADKGHQTSELANGPSLLPNLDMTLQVETAKARRRKPRAAATTEPQ
jgi:hypothetical protein